MTKSAPGDNEQGQRLGGPPDTGERHELVVHLPSRWAVGVSASIIVGTLAVLGAAAAVVEVRGTAFFGSAPFVAMFHLDRELSVPATVSLLGLTGCAVLLLVVAGSLKENDLADPARWRWLGFGFFYLAIDEGGQIHEHLNGVVDEFIDPVGVFRFGWTVVGIVVVLGLAVVFLPAVLRLPSDIRLLTICSAGLFVGGALGMEIVGGILLRNGESSPGYQLASWLEETGEMAGVGLFFYTLWIWWQRVAPLASLARTDHGTAQPVTDLAYG